MKRRNERPISALKNLGPKSAALLRSAGISTVEELAAIGAVKAYVRVKHLPESSASRNLLWAMAAGLEGRDWRSLTAEEKGSLTALVRAAGG